MNNLEILYDHYKNSCIIQGKVRDKRDRLLIILGIIWALLYLLDIDTQSTISVINNIPSLICKDVSIALGYHINVIRSLLWFILLYFSLRYYQGNMYVERQYAYIHSLENLLSQNDLQGLKREGENYLQNYPKILDAMHIIYTVVLPIVSLAIGIGKICFEFISQVYIVNILLDLALFAISSCLHILYIRFHLFENQK